MRSIFPIFSLDRTRLHWEDYLEVLTPVERIGDLYVKREDYFAPLGYGGVNGGKVRQLLWVLRQYLAGSPSQPGVLMGGSVRSPMVARVATVARHLGIPAHIVLSGDPQRAVAKHENVKIAKMMGATFSQAAAPYNPTLQRRAKALHALSEFQGHYLLEYALSLTGPPERLEAFYRFCAAQVQNIPEDVEVLLVPAGSCNTTLAVLYGLMLYPPKSVREVCLFGIGPTRVTWFEERLWLLELVSDLPLCAYYKRDYPHHPDLAQRYNQLGVAAKYTLRHFDLHSTGFANWQDEMPERIGALILHPTYEGKLWRYVQRHPEMFRDKLAGGKALLWIVGVASTYEAMKPYVEAV